MQSSSRPDGILWPLAFILCLGYTVWYFPRLIIVAGLANDNLTSQYTAAGPIDYLVLAGVLIALFFGVKTAHATSGELEAVNLVDRISLFLGRVTMVLIVILVSIMFYEVMLRYVFEEPTLWANELSLWLAGFIFLLSGLYAMQQRNHIRIYLLYDVLPRSLQRVCDTVSTLLIAIFAICLIWGGYNEALAKFLRWETFGTAFDPPIPATMKPMILIGMLIVALQAIANLIADWSKEAVVHAVVDEDEIDDIIHSVGGEK
ncbi:TRAP transporter small permease subunit [Pseudoruegeria sp. SK021]|uniref:TRAP transporter small permease subunit n=1 Tax=Pseudoruegeria sp. SK021 TaxID=1933035 RepID=UPI000A241D52|nr:TRAP transporter small permease subunit [Pseudoruegeria sp. SK021]OSP55983.1 hypothetical protein BV911_04875 [Pseudoruegeria sp. SK021]